FPRPLRPPDYPHGGGARISRSAPRRERDRWPAGLAAGLDPLLLSVQSHGAARGVGPGGIHSGRSAGGAPDRGPPFRRPHGAGRFGGLRSGAAVGSAPTTRDLSRSQLRATMTAPTTMSAVPSHARGCSLRGGAAPPGPARPLH